MKDKRDECGCHRGCTTLPHDCDAPCRWPSCLTADELEELEREIEQDMLNGGG